MKDLTRSATDATAATTLVSVGIDVASYKGALEKLFAHYRWNHIAVWTEVSATSLAFYRDVSIVMALEGGEPAGGSASSSSHDKLVLERLDLQPTIELNWIELSQFKSLMQTWKSATRCNSHSHSCSTY